MRPSNTASSVEVIGAFSRSPVGGPMFESKGKLELDCAPTKGAADAAANCSGSLASARTSLGGGTTMQQGALSELTVPRLVWESMPMGHQVPRPMLKHRLELVLDVSSTVAKVRPQMLPSS